MPRPAKIQYFIYTDGSCKWTRRKANNHGGWAFIVLSDHGGNTENVYRAGFEPAPQTNQTMELFAVLHALRYVKEFGLRSHPIEINTDSTYVINGMISQFRHQLAEGMISAPNSEIWLLLHRHAEACKHLTFKHVKGHAGHVWNEYCDRMASKARRDGTAAIETKRRKQHGV